MTNEQIQGLIELEQKNLRKTSFETASLLGEIGGNLLGTVNQIGTTKYRRPISMIGGSSPSGKWIAGLNYIMVNWKAPSLKDVQAFDNYVSIYGYNQNGRKINLSGNNYMTRNNFTYLKTAGANINGPLGIYKNAIEAVFNNGIRFWNKSFAANGTIGSFTDSVITGNSTR